MIFKKQIAAAIAGGVTVAVFVAAVSLGLPSLANAQTGTPPAQGNQATPNNGAGKAQINNRDQYLANALGITTTDLQNARTKARNAEIDAAVKAGTITQSQADALKNGQRGFRIPLNVTAADQQKYLADALGITVDKLQTAETTANKAALDQAVKDGRITQAQEDLVLGEQALQKYIADKGLFQSAVQAAVRDGALTQAQADAILKRAQSAGGLGFFGRGGLGLEGPGFFNGLGGAGPFGRGVPGPRGGFRGFGRQGAPNGANPQNATPAPAAPTM